MSSFETVLASERIYEGRLINLRVDQVRTPTGVESIREIVEHPGAIAIVALDEAGRVLLVKQYRHAVRAVTLEIPAGTLEAGEEPLAAAQRELREETGYRAGQLDRLGGIYTSPGLITEYIHLYLATQLSPDRLAMDDDEVIDLVRLPLADAIDLIRTGDIDDGKSVSGLLLAQRSITNPALPLSITRDGVRQLNASIAARKQFLRRTIAGFERKYTCSLTELNRRLEAREIGEHPAWEDAIEWGSALDQLAQVGVPT